MAALDTSAKPWEILHTVVAAGDATTDLTIAQRVLSIVRTLKAAGATGHGKIGIKTDANPLTASNTIRLRAVGTTENAAPVWKIYSGCISPEVTDCALSDLGTLTFTIGTQLSDIPGYYFADTLTVVDGDTVNTWSVKSGASNTVAEGIMDLHGDNVLVFVPTTDADAKLLGKFL